MSPRHWPQRVRDILEAAEEIEAFTAGMGYDDFVADPKTVKAVLADFAIIGEAAAHIPGDIMSRYADVEWDRMRDMRNRLIHVYFNVDTRVVWEAMKDDLPPLRIELNKVIENLDENSTG